MIRLAAQLGVLVLAVAACAEGYPPREPGITLSFDMSLEETLKAMNRIGAHDYMGSRWRYSVEACRLTVQTKGLRKAVGPVVIPVQTSTAQVQEDGAEQRYSVVTTWDVDTVSSRQMVLDGANWSDANQMKWLFDHLGRTCPADAVAAGAGFKHPFS